MTALSATENPIYNDDLIIDLTDDDEWHAFDCHGVEIDTNSGTWTADGAVTFVLYARPKHLPETPATPHVTDDQWCVGVIRVPLNLILRSAAPEHIIQAIQQGGQLT